MTSALDPAVQTLDVRTEAGGGKCQADGTVNLVRINLSPGDGWRCLRCGWNVYDPEVDQTWVSPKGA